MKLALVASIVLAFHSQAVADDKGQIEVCGRACVRAAHWRAHRLHVIRPYRAWLGTTGACESGTDRNLHHGLRVIGGGGAFRGRYQFSWRTWAAAGGHGDPAAASWLEQAYRAVEWRKRIGNPHQSAGWPVCG